MLSDENDVLGGNTRTTSEMKMAKFKKIIHNNDSP
jgi:hypothetical protein